MSEQQAPTSPEDGNEKNDEDLQSSLARSQLKSVEKKESVQVEEESSLAAARRKLKGPDESCHCMPAFTCAYCCKQINEWEQRQKEAKQEEDKQ